MENNEKFLSLDWFKNRVEASIDRVIEKKIENLVAGGNTPVASTEHPYAIVKLVNESLVVVMKDGNVYTKPNATEEDYLRIRDSFSEEEILAIIEDRVVAKEIKEIKKEAKKLTDMAEGFQKLSLVKDFKVEGQTVYLRGTSRSIPPLLIDKFATVVGRISSAAPSEFIEDALANDDEYQGLKNFFMWCCLNPRAEVADSLYNFLHQNGMKITKQGFFVALRNVVEVKGAGNSNLVQFVSNAYNKVKAVWKKDPGEYWVNANEDDTFSLLHGWPIDGVTTHTAVGNLTELYLDLPNMEQNRFTDNWTHTFDIRVGQVVNMPKEKANWSTQDCATAGLHFAGHTAPYVLCGDTTVFTLHNPMKVVGIGREKGRCWEYLPFMTTNVHEAAAIMNSNDFDFLQLDEEYALRELEDLEERVKEGFTTETSKYSFNLPSISSSEINSIVLSLEGMKNKITKRVSIID